MAEQQPASEQMRDLLHDTYHQGFGDGWLYKIQPEERLAAIAEGLWTRHMQEQTPAAALYARMQAEEQERAEMRALLERFADHYTPCEAGHRVGYCCFCDAAYDYYGDESVMEHADDCPIVQVRALLAKTKTGKEQEDGG